MKRAKIFVLIILVFLLCIEVRYCAYLEKKHFSCGQQTNEIQELQTIEQSEVGISEVHITSAETETGKKTEDDPTETEITDPNETELPATRPLATEPPATRPPATEPPATRPPATEPPATRPLATEPPATRPPATEPPATRPPATEPPETEPPATQPSDDNGSSNGGDPNYGGIIGDEE